MTTVHTSTKKNINGAAPKAVAKPAKEEPKKPAKETKEKPDRDAKVAPAIFNAQKVFLVTKRVSNVMKRTSGWSPETDAAALDVVDALTAWKGAFEKLGKDFTPPRRGGAPKSQLEVGSLVNIADRAKKEYEDILDPKEFVNLKVSKVVKSRVFVKTTEGNVLIIRRGHLEPVTAPKEAAKKN